MRLRRSEMIFVLCHHEQRREDSIWDRQASVVLINSPVVSLCCRAEVSCPKILWSYLLDCISSLNVQPTKPHDRSCTTSSLLIIWLFVATGGLKFCRFKKIFSVTSVRHSWKRWNAFVLFWDFFHKRLGSVADTAHYGAQYGMSVFEMSIIMWSAPKNPAMQRSS